MPKGVVQKIFTKAWDDGTTSYSFKLQGDETFYRLGNHSPQFSEGSSIQFDVSVKGNNSYVNEAPSPWVGDGTVQAPPVSTAGRVYSGSQGGYNKGNAGKGGRSFGGKSEEEKAYWAKRDVTQEGIQKKIEIQAARNAAIETAKIMWEKDICPKPKKVSEQYDSFLELVNLLMDTYLGNTEVRVSGADKGSVDRVERPVDTNVSPEKTAWED